MPKHYEVLRKGHLPTHSCRLPGLFTIWNQGLGPGAIIQCTECKTRWVRNDVNFRWSQLPPPVDTPPKPPTGGFGVPPREKLDLNPPRPETDK